jgi:hypothetical protein
MTTDEIVIYQNQEVNIKMDVCLQEVQQLGSVSMIEYSIEMLN